MVKQLAKLGSGWRLWSWCWTLKVKNTDRVTQPMVCSQQRTCCQKSVYKYVGFVWIYVSFFLNFWLCARNLGQLDAVRGSENGQTTGQADTRKTSRSTEKTNCRWGRLMKAMFFLILLSMPWPWVKEINRGECRWVVMNGYGADNHFRPWGKTIPDPSLHFGLKV